MEYENLHITDLVDIKIFEQIQHAFSKMTGMAAVTVDANGVPITRGSCFSEFCKDYTRNSPIGCSRCEQCDKFGVTLAKEKGGPATYYCHAGLMNFAAPIMAGNKLVGCFIGGQIRTSAFSPEKIVRLANDIGVDPDEYLAAAREVNIVDQEEISKSADFLYTISNALSNIAYNQYLVNQASIEIEKAANMKSDFLANMSHEIRTPMNAVIGMAEMALRENLTPAAREYINQIKAAGKSLLTIINDILDFSKIESGKMDINSVEYEPMSILNDLTNIIMTRLIEKNVELLLDISPEVPNRLLGDDIRIKQVLLNLANNAVKFTSKGKITIRMACKKLSNKKVELQVSIKDTGIGIKKEDMSKLFQSFQQLDSKRNRNVEGTGLGLAISKRLLTLMHGEIDCVSEHGKGSTFSFSLPQKVINNTPSIAVKDPSTILAVGLILNPYIQERLQADVTHLGVEYSGLDSEEQIPLLSTGKRLFFFIEHPMLSNLLELFIRNNPQITAVLIVDFNSTAKYDDIPNLLVVKKPLFALNIAMVFNHEELHSTYDNSSGDEFDFTAPDARILIVDDNSVNLTVAEGLLEPLKMKIDAALSGKEALDKIAECHYDIIFMDHMMPELDGVETTRIIRRFHNEYDDVPIIALTANAVDGTKEMFCQEGMNDFVAKPIELRMIVSKVKQWLPVEKIRKNFQTQNHIQQQPPENTNITVADLDVAYAVKLLGSEKLFWTVLKNYYQVIDKKVKLIKNMEEQENWPAYTIEVHALKSSSKQIGAMSLSEKAADLEKAGNARDSQFIHKKTDELLAQYSSYHVALQPYCEEAKSDESPKEEISLDKLLSCFADMKMAVDDLDMDKMEEVIQEMGKYGYQDWQQEMFEALKEAVNNIDVDSCETIMENWKDKL